MDKTYKRRFEELERCLLRIKSLYNGKIIIGDGEDSFHSPKDLVLNFFRVSYELKENLKLEEGFGGKDGIIERYCKENYIIGLSIDIANMKKHGEKDKFQKTNVKIGEINTHLHIFDPNRKDRTELTIEIDGYKRDCLALSEEIFNVWKTFLCNNNLNCL